MAKGSGSFLNLSPTAQRDLIDGARDAEPVSGLTHGFYKYPARFSPAFVRAAIDAFTDPGDLCLDPHVGGGTTLVEALAAGRNAIGVDISALAEFIAKVKSTVYTEAELSKLASWSTRVSRAIDIHKASDKLADYAELGYYKHLDHSSRWRLRKAVEQGIASATRLGTPRLESFGRCVVLRTAQWALDGRSKYTSVDEFRDFLGRAAVEMVEGARELHAAVAGKGGRRSKIEIIKRSTVGLERDERLNGRQSPKLVVTSPPYPGVHVLYHRWQVDGRKEAPLPFMIANKLDGAGELHDGQQKIPTTRNLLRQHPCCYVFGCGAGRPEHRHRTNGRFLTT